MSSSVSASLRIKVLFLIIAILALVLFNVSIQPETKKREEIEFEAWLSQLSESQKAQIREGDMPKGDVASLKSPGVHVSISPWSMEGGVSTDAKWEFGGDNVDDTKVLRLLELAREAGLFGLNTSTLGDLDNPLITLSVDDNGKILRASFLREQVKNNVKAQNFLKLVQLYSTSGKQTGTVQE